MSGKAGKGGYSYRVEAPANPADVLRDALRRAGHRVDDDSFDNVADALGQPISLAEQQSMQARQTLRGLPHTRDTVIHLLMIEAGVAIIAGTLVKSCNLKCNDGVTAELALVNVIKRHLRA